MESAVKINTCGDWTLAEEDKLIQAPFSSHVCQNKFLIHSRPLYTESAAKFKYNFHSTH